MWCEYWSAALGRWVHCDPCEAAWDTPLLYEVRRCNAQKHRGAAAIPTTVKTLSQLVHVSLQKIVLMLRNTHTRLAGTMVSCVCVPPWTALCCDQHRLAGASSRRMSSPSAAAAPLM